MGQVLARFLGREVGRDSVVLALNTNRSRIHSFHLLLYQRTALLLPLLCPAPASMQFSIHPICIYAILSHASSTGLPFDLG